MRSDQDEFISAELYERWHPRRRRLSLKALAPPGKNWESKLLLANESGAKSRWQAEISSTEGQTVTPVLLQRSGQYELVWFSHGPAVLQPAFHAVVGKFGKVQFSVHPDRQAIHARKGNTVIALLWPSPVPNPETALSAQHEMAMRSKPPEDHELLTTIVLEQLRPALGQGAEELYQAASRLKAWLQGIGPLTCPPLTGITEWDKCRALRHDVGYVFKNTNVPVDFMFRKFMKGGNIAEFLADHPTVTAGQVYEVLGYPSTW